jgi:hypothetical protein
LDPHIIGKQLSTRNPTCCHPKPLCLAAASTTSAATKEGSGRDLPRSLSPFSSPFTTRRSCPVWGSPLAWKPFDCRIWLGGQRCPSPSLSVIPGVGCRHGSLKVVGTHGAVTSPPLSVADPQPWQLDLGRRRTNMGILSSEERYAAVTSASRRRVTHDDNDFFGGGVGSPFCMAASMVGEAVRHGPVWMLTLGGARCSVCKR